MPRMTASFSINAKDAAERIHAAVGGRPPRASGGWRYKQVSELNIRFYDMRVHIKTWQDIASIITASSTSTDRIDSNAGP